MKKLLLATAIAAAILPTVVNAQQVVGFITNAGVGTPVAVSTANPLPVSAGDGSGLATAALQSVIQETVSSITANRVYVYDHATGLPIDWNAPVNINPYAVAGTTTLSMTTSSARVALPTTGTTVLVYNSGTTNAHIKLGNSSVTAATTDQLVLPGTMFAIGNPAGANVDIAAIMESSTGTLSISTGSGSPFATGAGGAFSSSLPAGANTIGGVTLVASTTGGCTPSGLASTASTNSTSIKPNPGTFCGGIAINTTATIYYLRIYDLASGPTCSSATGFITSIPIPASTTGAGTLLNLGGTFGAAFVNGIAYCLTGGGSSTDNTNAATGVYLSYSYK